VRGGGVEQCRTTLQHCQSAPFTSALCKSRDTCGNFLRLVRPIGPCRGRLVAIRRTHPSELVVGRSPGICGNFLRPARQACPCFRRHAAIARIPRPADGRLPVQSQWIGKKPRPELQKEQLPPRRRTHIFVFLATFLILQLVCADEERGRFGGLSIVEGSGRSGRYRFSLLPPFVRADLHGLHAGLRFGARPCVDCCAWNDVYGFTKLSVPNGDLKGVDMNAGRTGSSETVDFELSPARLPPSRAWARVTGPAGLPSP
jgi:hypothetical protein